jgi:hypothetical protein
VGIARIVSIDSTTTATVDVTAPFGSTGQTNIWQPGLWKPGSLEPQCGCFGKGRLITSVGREVVSSNSDNFFSFTDGVGSIAPQAANTSIDSVITSKSSEISWLACLDYLCIGTRREENVAHSNVPTDAMGPATFVSDLMTQNGGAGIDPLTISSSVIFAHRTRRKLLKFAHNPKGSTVEAFTSADLTRLHPEMAKSGIVRYDATEEPERRIYTVLGDGTVRPLLFRPEEETSAWARIATDIGRIVDVAVLHEEDEDKPYFLIENPGTTAGTYDYTLTQLPRELPVNPWDHRYLDNHVCTPYYTGLGNVTPSDIEGGITLFFEDATDFAQATAGTVIWIDGGRVLVDTVLTGNTVEGTVLAPLTGKDNRDGTVTAYPISPARWMIAQTSSTITVPAVFIGETLSVYADLAYAGEFLVPSSGIITLPAAASRIVAGKPMSAFWKSLKLAYGAQKGTAVGQRKKCIQVCLILDRTGDGLQIGSNFADMYPVVTDMDDPISGIAPAFFTGEINSNFEGEFDTDPRLCLRMDGPQPCTITGYVANIETHER